MRKARLIIERIPANPIIRSGLFRSPELPNANVLIVSLRVIGISDFAECFYQRLSFQFYFVTAVWEPVYHLSDLEQR